MKLYEAPDIIGKDILLYFQLLVFQHIAILHNFHKLLIQDIFIHYNYCLAMLYKGSVKVDATNSTNLLINFDANKKCGFSFPCFYMNGVGYKIC
jgi:hypothetical protein